MLEGADVAVLPSRAGTPHARRCRPPSRRLADSCFDWIRRKVTRTIREPALLLCRATALRRMMVAARPSTTPIRTGSRSRAGRAARSPSCVEALLQRRHDSRPARTA